MVVPALNEAESLLELFLRTKAVFELQDQSFEFIVVDDGSTDETRRILQALRAMYPQVAYVRHAKPHGKSMALMQGFDMAGGDVVITMDGDLQDQPEDIPAFLAKLAEGYDLVGGWRKDRRDTGAKRMVSGVFNKLTRMVGGFDFRDINCGFKAYSSKALDKMNLRGEMHRITPLVGLSHGFSYAEIPVNHAPRKHGTSRFRLLRHRGLLDLASFVVVNTTRLRPLHVFTEVAILLGMAAVLLLGLHWPAQAYASQTLGTVMAFAGTWLLAVATLLPLFGFILEVLTSYHQGGDWRQGLSLERVEARCRMQ